MSRQSLIRTIREQCKSLTQTSSGDDSNWHIQLVDKNMHELYKIKLHLPHQFPTRPPQVTVTELLDHPWINPSNKSVRHPLISNWDSRNEIGLIMMDILREFTTKKPRILNSQSDGRRDSVADSSASQSVIEVVGMPTIPQDFPELDDLPLDALEKLETDPAELEKFIHTMPIVVKYATMSKTENEKSVSVCTRVQDEHTAIRSKTEHLDNSFEELGSLRKQLEDVMAERDAVMAKFTPKNLVKDLNELAESTDKETTQISGSSSLALEDLKSKILQQRILHHKAAALSELLMVHSGSHIITSPRSSYRK